MFTGPSHQFRRNKISEAVDYIYSVISLSVYTLTIYHLYAMFMLVFIQVYKLIT